MMGVLRQGGGMGTVGRGGAVAVEAEILGGLAQVRRVLRAVRVVAGEAGDAVGVHLAGDVVVPLHAIFVRCAVSKMSERGVAKLVLLQLPEIAQFLRQFIAHGPVVVIAFDRIGQRPPLGVALDAHVVGRYVVHAGRIEDGGGNGLLHVLTAGAVALFATDVPFSDLLGLDVVVHRVAAIAEGAGRALEIVGRIKGHPPVVFHIVGLPLLVGHVPLGGKRKVVIAHFLEVALLPQAAVNEGDIGGRKGHQRIGFFEVRSDGVGMFLGIAHHVCHRRFLPVLIDLPVTLLAGDRANVVGIRRGSWTGLRLQGGCHGKLADERNELPGLLIWELPPGHRGVANAVPDQVEQLTVRAFPPGHGRLAQIGHGRIHPASGGGLAFAVGTMADIAVFLVQFPTRRHGGTGDAKRVFERSCLAGDA